MKQPLFILIKVISTILISSAIGLEVWNRYAAFTSISLPNIPTFIIWLSRFALISHGIEGVIAAFYAPSKQKSAISYGIYTFFTGTVGLFELFDSRTNSLNAKF